MATHLPPLSRFGSALPSSTHPAVGAWTEQPRISCSEARPSALDWTWGPGLGGAVLSTPWKACDVAETVPTQGDLLMTNLALASIIHKEHLGTRSKHTLSPPLPLKTFVKFAPGRETESQGTREGRGAQRPGLPQHQQRALFARPTTGLESHVSAPPLAERAVSWPPGPLIPP